VRFAGQLARLRPTVGGWLDPRARALRVLIESDPAGRLRYSVEAPARSVGLLRTALGTYEQVELRDPGPAPPAATGKAKVARAELVLARPSHHPLARLGLDPDPLQAVASALARLRPDLGDGARIAIDVRPCSPSRRRRRRARLLRAARHDSLHARSQGPSLWRSARRQLAGAGDSGGAAGAPRRGPRPARQARLWGAPARPPGPPRVPLKARRPATGPARGAAGVL